MRRFLLLWLLLSPTYLVAAGLFSWLVLNRLDLTFEAVASWIVVPPLQALALVLFSRPLSPSQPRVQPGPSPRASTVLLAAGAVAVVIGLSSPHDPVVGAAAAGGIQPVIRRLFVLVAGLSFVASGAAGVTRRRTAATLFGLLLTAVGLDLVLPWLEVAPKLLVSERSVFVPGLLVYGGLLAIGILLALGARPLAGDAPWAGRLLDAAVAVTFGAAHGAALNYVRHSWLSRPWDSLLPAAASVAAAFLAASGAALLSERETKEVSGSVR